MAIDVNTMTAALMAQIPAPARTTPATSVDPNLVTASEIVSDHADASDPLQSAIVTLGAGNASDASLYNAQGLVATPEAAQLIANQDPVSYWTNALPANPAMLPTLLQEQANQSLINLIA
jgi:hypothetical protein